MTPQQFIKKWRDSTLKERSASQSHFNDLCALLGEPTPTDVDPDGTWYTFERGAKKTGGGDGWADVWKRGCFAWEYKGKHKDLIAAFAQLQRYAIALENPPLLIVSDMDSIVIHTNFTNTVQEIHVIPLDELENPDQLRLLKQAFTESERLKPGITTLAITEQAASRFAELAQALRGRGNEPQQVAHFLNKLLFCLFAEDVGLLPNQLFTKLLETAVKRPQDFLGMAQDLFRAMQKGGRVGFEAIEWFNGGLFDDDHALPLEEAEVKKLLQIARMDWSAIEPSIFGTLFERGLDPDNRLIVIPRNDDMTFGILSSRIHVCWALAVGSTLEDRPAYATTTCFETFPFPAGLTPADNVSLPPLQGEGWGGDGVNGATETHPHPNLPPEGEGAKARISTAARRLNELRENWLNPPEWVDWVRTPEEEKAGYPARPVAYGWDDYTSEMADEEILRRLLALNLARAG